MVQSTFTPPPVAFCDDQNHVCKEGPLAPLNGFRRESPAMHSKFLLLSAGRVQ
jgi:hypothetical protein